MLNKYASLIFKWLIDWRYLPFKAQVWLFGTGTRAVEVMSLAAIMALLILFVFEPRAIAEIPVYRKFNMIPPNAWITSLSFAAAGIGSTINAKRYVLQVINGGFLIFSGLIFMLVGAAFIIVYPPFSLSMFIFPALSILCTLAGNNKIRLTKEGNLK